MVLTAKVIHIRTYKKYKKEQAALTMRSPYLRLNTKIVQPAPIFVRILNIDARRLMDRTTPIQRLTRRKRTPISLRPSDIC